MDQFSFSDFRIDFETIRNIASHWVLHAFVVVFITLLLSSVVRRVMDRLEKKAEVGTKTPWDEAIVRAVRRPLSVFIWIAGIAFAAEVIGEETDAAVFDAVGPIRQLAFIGTVVWFLTLMVKEGEAAFQSGRESAGKPVDIGTVATVGKLLRLSVIITGGLAALQSLGFSISGVLAFGGIGGVAVGFAAKDLLANFFGGMMIFLDRPFKVGDWIYSPDREIEGTVEDISWRLTRIRTFDKRPLYIPNAAFSTISVINPSRMTHRRIYETIGIRYDDGPKMRVIVEAVREMLLKHPDLDSSQTLIVHFNSFAASSLDFFIYTFTKTTEWVPYHAVKEDVMLKVMDIITEHGAEIAFPTSTLHLVPPGPENPGAGELPEAVRKAVGMSKAKAAGASAPKRRTRKKQPATLNNLPGGEL